MVRSTRLTTGIRSAPTTEMYTTCWTPARDAARTRMPGLVLIALGAARAVHDGSDPVHRGFEPFAGGQIADHELDAVRGFVAVPAEYPHGTAGVPQAWHDEAPERACAAGNQKG